MDLVSILATAIGTALAGASVFALLKYFWERWEQKRKGKGPTLQDRISSLTKNLESSIAAITEIETEISKRRNLAQQLEADIRRYNQLKEINQAQVEAIAQTLKIPLEKESRKSLIKSAIISFVTALIFFAIGYFVGGR